MKRKWIRTAAAVLLAAVLLTTPGMALTIGGATVTGSSVRLRTSTDTSTDANVLLEMPKGAFLLVEAQLGGWYQVVYNGVKGYVSADFAEFSETAEGTYQFDAATSGSDVNLRAAAGTGSAVMKNLKKAGTAVTVTGVSGQWLRVTDEGGKTGYVRSDLVRYQRAAATGSAAQTAGDELVQTAMLYKGYAYRWGGMSPSTGFDCSGFVNYVCAQHDITLNRVAQDIYTNDGTAVSKDELQPGDLVFFGWGPYSVTHVGLYIGDGQMIHASTSTTGVILSDLNSSYYTRKYVGAKRVV